MIILIKGMEMPKTCRDCRLSTFTNFDSMPFCDITMDDICLNDWETKRCDNCPLVPVPPHGDLIERNELLMHRFAGVVGETKMYMLGWNTALEAVAENAPTIIPTEEGGA